MKIIAWNVNGIRSLVKNNINDLNEMITNERPNVICFGETKLSCPIDAVEKLLKDNISGFKYRYYSTCTDKGGYSGTAIFSNKKPNNVIYDMDLIGKNDLIKIEGRIITLEFDKFYLIHVYTPNSGIILARLDYRITKWDVVFRKFINFLQKTKPVIICGDLNVANESIDIYSPKTNTRTAGYTNEERTSFKQLLNDCKLIDTFRYLHPTKIEYSYWSYRQKSREKNKGWRIDYFLVSARIIATVHKSKILTNNGSDHAPIKLSI